MRSMSESSVLKLVDGIYEAGMAFERWPTTLERVADAFGASDAALGSIGPPGLSWLCAPRTDPSYLSTYPENFHAVNDVWHRMVKKGVGAATTDQMVIPRREFVKSAYYNEWAKPQGFHYVVGGVIDAARGWRTVLTLPGRNSYGPDANKLFCTLSSHIRRAVQLNRRLERTDIDSDAVSELVQRLSCAAILVDAEARVLLMNHAAETLVESNRGLRISKHKLHTSARNGDATLHALIAHCARDGLAECGDGIEVPTPFGIPLKLSLLPLRRRLPRTMPGTPAALVFDATGDAPFDFAAQLHWKYGLTDAEARFAQEIVKGDGKRAAAARCGISYSTARTHLSRIFEKTGVHRQAALVRILSG